MYGSALSRILHAFSAWGLIALPCRINTSVQGWGDDPDLDVDPDAVRGKRPFWKRKRVWIIVAMLTVSFAFIVAGVCVLEFKAGSHTANFQVWRLFFFIAGLPFIWWGADIATRVDIWAPENSFFAEKNVIYFMYRVRVRSAGINVRMWLGTELVMRSHLCTTQ